MALSTGAIQRMANNDTSLTPRLQVLDVKKIVTGSSGERYRLVLSDGQFYIQGYMASQCTELVSTNQLRKYSIIHLKEFVCNNVSGKKICVVIQCDVVQQMTSGIGKPKNVVSAAVTAPSRAAPPPPPPQHQAAFHQRGNNYGNNQNRSAMGGMNTQPVSSLNPYQNNWRIKVRCTRKDTMRHYHNQKGEGKLFGVDLLDSQGTEIRAVMFNEAAEKFFSVFEENKVFVISRGLVRLAKKGYSHIKNDYSITLNADAEVLPVRDDACEIETQKYKFIKIADIAQAEPKSFVDVIGVIIDVGQLASVMSNRTQQEVKRRNIKIADETAKIDVTLWREEAENFDEQQAGDNCIVALKAAKVSDFGGRSLTANAMAFNPDRQETRGLLHWISQNNGNLTGLALNELTSGGQGISKDMPRLTLQEVKDKKLGETSMAQAMESGRKKKMDFFTTVATITTITHSAERKIWYEANPDPNCEFKNAKVIAMGQGQWRCEKNGKVYDRYIPRYIMRFCINDFSSNIWLTAFDEVASKILKKDCKEAERLFSNDPDAYEQMFKDAQFKKYVFRCKAFTDVWEDSMRVRYDCVGVEIADCVHESEKLLEKIEFIQNLKNNSNNNVF